MTRRPSLESLDLARAIIDVIEDVKVEDIVLLDLHEITLIADYFVICTGTSERQLRAVVERLDTTIKKDHGILPFHTEGQAGSGWVLIDYSSVVVHVFSEEARRYYDLEGVWNEANVLLHMQ
ncbi:MAG: ribosome silencing factor [Anaerolineae bacterium]|nr:ribosome silencing factor [Anaerolineae bacterium]